VDNLLVGLVDMRHAAIADLQCEGAQGLDFEEGLELVAGGGGIGCVSAVTDGETIVGEGCVTVLQGIVDVRVVEVVIGGWTKR